MATINLLGSLKVTRLNAILTAIGASGFMDIYTGSAPTDTGTSYPRVIWESGRT